MKERPPKLIIYDILTAFLVGFLFGLGLAVSGMVSRAKIIGFLTFDSNWDPSLLFVFGGAVIFNLISFNIIKAKMTCPVNNDKFYLPQNNKNVNWELIVGSILFGIGWGLSGLCPGPMILNLQFLTPHVTFLYFGFLFLGQLCVALMKKCMQKSKKQKVEK